MTRRLSVTVALSLPLRLSFIKSPPLKKKKKPQNVFDVLLVSLRTSLEKHKAALYQCLQEGRNTAGCLSVCLSVDEY